MSKINEDLRFLRSFPITPLVPLIENNGEVINLGIKNSVSQASTDFSVWYHNTKIELLNRLVQLEDYFSKKMLLQLKLKKFYVDDINLITYKKTAKYYNYSIVKIKKELDNLLVCCYAINEIEIIYLRCYFEEEIVLETQNFKIMIR